MKTQTHRMIQIRKLALAVTLALAAVLPCHGQHAERTWTSADGTRTFQGTLVSIHESNGTITVRKPDGSSSIFKQIRLSRKDIDYLQAQASLIGVTPDGNSEEGLASPSAPAGRKDAVKPAADQGEEFEFAGNAVVRLLKTGNAAEFAATLSPREEDWHDYFQTFHPDQENPETKAELLKKISICDMMVKKLESDATAFLEVSRSWNINFDVLELKAATISTGNDGDTGFEFSPGDRSNPINTKHDIEVLLTATPLPGNSGTANQAGGYRVNIEALQKFPKGWRNSGLSYALRWISIPKTAAEERLLPKEQRLALHLEQIDEELKSLTSGNRMSATPKVAEKLLALLKEFPDALGIHDRLMDLANQGSGDLRERIAQSLLEYPEADRKHWECKVLLESAPFVAEDHLGKPLDIKFTAIDGREVDLANLRGKVVLLHFWGTWCGPCLTEIPDLIALHGKYRHEKFEIISICFDSDMQRVIDFSAKKGIPWPQRFEDTEQRFSENSYVWKFKIKSYPTMWLIDKAGNLASVRAKHHLEDQIEKLLAGKKLVW